MLEKIEPTPDLVAYQAMRRFEGHDHLPDAIALIQTVFFADILYLFTTGKELIKDRIISNIFTPMHSMFSTTHACNERIWTEVHFDQPYPKDYIAAALDRPQRDFIRSIARVVLDEFDSASVRGHILKLDCVRNTPYGKMISKQAIVDGLNGDDAVSRMAQHLGLREKETEDNGAPEDSL
jgi:hypothetical protein